MDTSTREILGIFFKHYGTLIVAIYGVVQLWLVGIFKLIFRRGRVELYTAEVVEVGYSSFGPTLGLYGTLTTLHKDSFVNNISLLVRRERDRAEHRFNWLAFRSNQFTFSSNSQIAFELPSGFIITPTQPHRYNIIFSDSEQYVQMAPSMRQIEEMWSEQVRAVLSSSPTPNYAALFHTFAISGRTELTDFHSLIQRFGVNQRF